MSSNDAYVNDDAVGMTSFSTAPEATSSSSSKVHPYELDEVKVSESGFKSSRSSSLSSIDHDGPYAGMPKEVLLKYSRQKKFVWARNILFGLVILTILTLISLVIAIIVISPPCLDYWQTSPIYQIYPKSFKDSWSPPDLGLPDGETDGIGDLYGVIDQLSYFEELGVRVLWLNPIYESPQKDNGYDISDFRAIDETFGGMDAMDKLIEEIHNLGMKIVMDFVPNHSSNQHKWFQASSDPNHEEYDTYKDYYMWVAGANANDIPNNWVSEFDNTTSAWTWNTAREEFYYHGFYAEQPDLNLRNSVVKEELRDILRFWMEKGVDGFRCDALAYMLEAEHLRDNPVVDSALPVNKANIYADYTQNYKGVHDIVADWRALLDEYSTEPGVYRFMQTEVYTDNIEETLRYYGTERAPEGDFPMNFLLITADPDTEWNATSMSGKVLEWMRNMPAGRWPSWTVSNHDNSRLPSRVGWGLARCAAVMIMTLPGTPGFYYGDEIGMTDNNNIPADQSNDFRDPERTPMQWNGDGDFAGFCENCEPWLPVNQDYVDINVENQRADSDSMLQMYKRLISLRQEMVYQRGYFCMLEVQAGNTLAFIRELPGLNSRLILINFDDAASGDSTINMNLEYDRYFPATGTVTFVSQSSGSVEVGRQFDFGGFALPASRGIIIDFERQDTLFHEGGENECFIHTKVCYDKALGIVKTC